MLHTVLSHLDRTRLDFRVAYLSERQESPMRTQIESLGVPVDYISIRRMTQPTGLPRVIRYLREQRFDLVHTQLVTSIVLGSAAAKWLGIPSVATLHTLDTPPPGSRTEKRRMMMWWVLRRWADRVIAVSEQTRRHHIEYGRIPAGKVHVLYNGVDCGRFQTEGKPWRGEVREELGIPAEAPVMMTVAVLREPKGIQHMIAAMPGIIEQAPETRYVIVGSGPYENELKDLAMASPAAEAIQLTGPRDDVPELLVAADIFVHPTLDDALPTVLAEAMAAGKAIVASDVGGVPEMVQDRINGLLVPPADVGALADACVSLIQDGDTRHRMQVKSRSIAEHTFNVEKQVASLTALYMQLIEGKPDG